KYSEKKNRGGQSKFYKRRRDGLCMSGLASISRSLGEATLKTSGTRSGFADDGVARCWLQRTQVSPANHGRRTFRRGAGFCLFLFAYDYLQSQKLYICRGNHSQRSDRV